MSSDEDPRFVRSRRALLSAATDLVESGERVAQLRDLHLDSDPGTAYVYSNLNYHVAARLVEVSSGQDFSTYLHDHVFPPLGMGCAAERGHRRRQRERAPSPKRAMGRAGVAERQRRHQSVRAPPCRK